MFKTKTTLLYHYALVLVGTFDAMKWTQETPGLEPE